MTSVALIAEKTTIILIGTTFKKSKHLIEPHDTGGLTSQDFDFATKIDEVYSS